MTNLTGLRLKNPTTLTISSGAVTATLGFHIIAAETGTADDLDTITAGHVDLSVSGTTYRPELWIIADSGDTITLTHQTGNISLPGGFDINLTSTTPMKLIYNGTYWMPSFWEPAACIVLDSGQETSDAATVAISGWTNPVWTPSKFVLSASGFETDRAADYRDHILVSFNADTTAANYNTGYITGQGGATASGVANGTKAGIWIVNRAAAANADSGCFGMFELTIYNPLGTSDKKHVLAKAGLSSESANEYGLLLGTGHWETTDAITSITLTPENGTTFLVGDAGEPTTLDWVLYAYR